MPEDEEHNCGRHIRRVAPHWDGAEWCNGRPNPGHKEDDQ